MQEFRRGVERANITCLAWSWDDAWLACTSDKGTAHVFQVTNEDEERQKKQAAASAAASSSLATSLTQRLFSTVIHTVEGDAKKSVCQIRGVPHPQACAFVADAPNLLAVAGWDADGNGVVLLAEYAPNQEPRRVGYHIVCQCSAVADASEEARRRRRLRGWTPEIPQTPEGGRLYVGERLEILEKNMEQIHFEEKDEFVEVTAVRPQEQDIGGRQDSEGGGGGGVAATFTTANADEENAAENSMSTAASGSNKSEVEPEAARSSNTDHSTVGDSVRTEPLEEDNSDGCEVLSSPPNDGMSPSSSDHQQQHQ